MGATRLEMGADRMKKYFHSRAAIRAGRTTKAGRVKRLMRRWERPYRLANMIAKRSKLAYITMLETIAAMEDLANAVRRPEKVASSE